MSDGHDEQSKSGDATGASREGATSEGNVAATATSVATPATRTPSKLSRTMVPGSGTPQIFVPPPAAGGPAVTTAAPPQDSAPAAPTPAPAAAAPTPESPSTVVVSEGAPAAAATSGIESATAAGPRVATGEGISVVFAGMTSVGLVREHNEDNLVVVDLATKQRQPMGETLASRVTKQGMLFAVCDGMGGAAAGEVASQMAVDFLHEQTASVEFGGDRDRLARHLVSVVERAGKQIFDTAQADRSRRGMGTTSTVVALLDNVLFAAQVGDSRAYILRNGVLRLITKDQSLVNQLIEAGHLTEEEAEAFEHSNIILQALGTAEKVQVDLTFAELRQGDRLMMCSDGLSGLIHADGIAETLRTVGDPAACCAKLTEQANEGGGHDNITVIVADFNGDGLVPPVSGETAAYNQYPLLPEGAAQQSSGAGSAASMYGDGGTSPGVGEAGGAWQWWMMGLVAILAGAAISWWWDRQQPSIDDASMLQPAPEVQPAAELEPPEDDLAELELVPARITTDAELGLLLIDGEPRGQLGATSPRDLDLAPGSYRIELQIEGSVAVSQVVTIEVGTPIDVELRLPMGSGGSVNDPSQEASPADPSQTADPPRKARGPTTAEPSEPAPTKPAPVKVAPPAGGSTSPTPAAGTAPTPSPAPGAKAPSGSN